MQLNVCPLNRGNIKTDITRSALLTAPIVERTWMKTQMLSRLNDVQDML